MTIKRINGRLVAAQTVDGKTMVYGDNLPSEMPKTGSEGGSLDLIRVFLVNKKSKLKW